MSGKLQWGGFNRGAACVLAELIRAHYEPSMAADIFRQCGFTVEDFEASGVDPADMALIRAATRELTSRLVAGGPQAGGAFRAVPMVRRSGAPSVEVP